MRFLCEQLLIRKGGVSTVRQREVCNVEECDEE